MYCKNCGSILEQGAQFCRACGAPNRGLALAGVIISSVYLALSVLAALVYMLWFLFVFWMIGSAGSTYASSAVLAIWSIII